jgi:adenylate cyclase
MVSRFEEMGESHRPGKRSYARSFPQTHALADRAARLSKWLTQEGRFVSGNRELLDQFCARVIEAGVPLSRSWLHIRTLHPEFAGVSRVWRRGMQTEERFLDFGFEK